MGNIFTTTKKRSDWSSLPEDLLWSIKDKLDVVDATRVDLVCKNWKSASERYRRPASKVVLFHRGDSTLCQCFVDVLTKEYFMLDLSELGKDTELLSSKKGWLLLIHSFFGYPPKRPNIIIFNLESNVKILMPPVPGKVLRRFSGSLSLTNDDIPCLVVLITQNDTRLDLYVGEVADRKWTTYSCAVSLHTICRFTILIIGMQVYCLGDTRGSRLFIFNLTTLVSIEVPWNSDLESPCLPKYHWLIESEEKIMAIEESSDGETLSLFKLDDSQTDWERLPTEDFMGRSWFIGSTNNFAVKETDKDNMVYLLSTAGLHPNVCTYIRIIDLRKKVERSANLRAHAEWVDLGQLCKLPKSTLYHYPAGKEYVNNYDLEHYLRALERESSRFYTDHEDLFL